MEKNDKLLALCEVTWYCEFDKKLITDRILLSGNGITDVTNKIAELYGEESVEDISISLLDMYPLRLTQETYDKIKAIDPFDAL